MQTIHTPLAPAPIGPYSQAVRHGNLLYISGQIALDPETGILVSENVQEETHQVMRNLAAILEAGGSSFSQVIKASIFLSSMDHFTAMNAVYGSCFSEGHVPARETIAVLGLPRGVNVEISMIATVTTPVSAGTP
ncbi:MAG: RidA family protein [Sphingomonadales bacterium]|nr:RidA family protein [Sphingomonadales bacterium]